MLQKIKTKLIVLSSVLFMAAPIALPAAAHALDPAADPQNGVCQGASTLQLGKGGTTNAPATGNCSAQDQTDKVNNIITLIINIFSVVVGIIAVIMIIYAGFKYITSGGKEDSVKTAKNTILYALIGLVIVALAQIIVKFVLSKAVNT